MLLGTKQKSIPRALICQNFPFSLVNGVYLPSRGASGGIWIVWNTRKIEISYHWVNNFSVSVKGKRKGTDDEWFITSVYGPYAQELKPLFFQELNDLRNLFISPWCICGDFNEILFLEDRSGEGGLTPGAKLFAEFINNHFLRDVPIAETSFTWLNMQSPPVMSKLDRFLTSAEWDISFPFFKGLARPRPVSDHFPIVLCGKQVVGTPKPFKFEYLWLQVPNLKN